MEHNYFITADFNREINQPWLENKALDIEVAILRDLHGPVLGPSVAANWGENKLEMHVTIDADSIGEVHRTLGKIMDLVERETGFEFGSGQEEMSEIHSDLQCPEPQNHEIQVYAPA